MKKQQRNLAYRPNYTCYLILILMLLGLGQPSAARAALDPANETPEQRDARMNWWREARFGMFIHWGVYAVPAGVHQGKPVGGIGEWIMSKGKISIPEYEAYARQFNPVKFDAETWVRIAKDAGMKYLVITSKHHDGFCLWDSKLTEYDIIDYTPFDRDVLKELAAACEKHGIRFCIYYSIMDWHHPDAKGKNFAKYRDDYMIPQLEELLSGEYGDVGVLWFDGEWIREWTSPQGKALYQKLREIKPDLIVNNRVDKGRKGMAGMNKAGDFAGDFGTPEKQIPDQGFGPGVDWETCMTMNDTWGYKSNDHNWKSSEKLIRQLVDTASKGGNYLLNIGPMADGIIPEPSVERLAAMGDWMEVNSESIYGTLASPVEKPAWGRVTRKPDGANTILYLHVFEWPQDGSISLPLANRVISSRLLADSKRELSAQTVDGAIAVKLTGEAPDPVCSVIKLVVNGSVVN